MDTTTLNSWFPLASGTPTSVVQLFCLPHAGVGASTYRPWAGRFPPEVAAVPVQFPGREARFAEPAVPSAVELVGLLLEPLLARADRPFALFGHSMGALLAFELAHAAARRTRPPVHLFVSGFGAPHLPPSPDLPHVHLLPDPELTSHLGELAGTPAEVLDRPDLMKVLLPTMRADFAVCETYRWSGRPPLPVPITALGGVDDTTATAERLGAWAELTSRAFSARRFSGGHFYLLEHTDEVIRTVATDLMTSLAERTFQ
ncbi:thioesterase II family protein [Amycolatopsis sp. NPDC088138]|uniref:thioesterase II family protein n=1 Tax=Amycolatopsis sp. NPDC088138 TaxID=3363938 RepID=UPI00382C09B9